jgi:hypothetical protein
MGQGLLAKLAGVFLDKKRVIGWVSAVAFVALSGMAGMQTKEFKEAVCGSPTIEEKK